MPKMSEGGDGFDRNESPERNLERLCAIVQKYLREQNLIDHDEVISLSVSNYGDPTAMGAEPTARFVYSSKFLNIAFPFRVAVQNADGTLHPSVAFEGPESRGQEIAEYFSRLNTGEPRTDFTKAALFLLEQIPGLDERGDEFAFQSPEVPAVAEELIRRIKEGTAVVGVGAGVAPSSNDPNKKVTSVVLVVQKR